MRLTVLVMGFGLLFTTTAHAGAPSTQHELRLAYEEDMSEHARYLAYADQAEREGYAYAARLFRATAEAERVRAEIHAQVLRRLGAEPSADIGPVSVTSTRVNLVRTLAHETAELRRGYARRTDEARREGNAEAALSFMVVRGAHEELVKLYQEALRDPQRRPGAGDELHVCRTCGHVARGHAPDRCPVSLSSADAFVRID
jgi:rubrerythrin